MIHTCICDLLGIVHPIILGGMGTATTAPLVAAVSNAGGFGTLGTSAFNAATLETEIASIRERTEKPFGINHLLFQIQEDMLAVTPMATGLRRRWLSALKACCSARVSWQRRKRRFMRILSKRSLKATAMIRS